MVERGFGGAVGAPGGIGAGCCAGRCEDYAAVGFAQVGEGGGYLVECDVRKWV